jgi:allantoicase
LQPDTVHRFPVRTTRPAALIRLDIFPDGGLARLRLYGKVFRADRAALADRLRECAPPGVR